MTILNRWFKGVMYEGSTRIPLLMKAPAASPFAATFNRGAVVSDIVENNGVVPEPRDGTPATVEKKKSKDRKPK